MRLVQVTEMRLVQVAEMRLVQVAVMRLVQVAGSLVQVAEIKGEGCNPNFGLNFFF